MTYNLSRTDRTIRLVGAVLLIVLALFLMGGASQWVASGAAVVLAGTAAVGTCPAYLPFGFSTRRQRRACEEDEASC